MTTGINADNARFPCDEFDLPGKVIAENGKIKVEVIGCAEYYIWLNRLYHFFKFEQRVPHPAFLQVNDINTRSVYYVKGMGIIQHHQAYGKLFQADVPAEQGNKAFGAPALERGSKKKQFYFGSVRQWGVPFVCLLSCTAM